MKKHYLSAYAGLPKEIYILFAARIITCMGSFILPLLTLILTQKLGMSKSGTGSFIALLSLTQVPSLLLGGKLVDSIGRKKILVIFQTAGAFFYMLCGILHNSSYMIPFIVIASNLYVVSYPAYDAMLADLTNSENRKSAYSLIYLGINIGMTFSPIIGGLLFNDYLPLLFLLDAVTTLACVLLIAVNVKETYRKTDGQKKTDQNQAAPKGSVFSVMKAAPVLVVFILLMFFYDFTYSQWNFILPIQFGDFYGKQSAPLFSALSATNAFTVITLTPLITKLTHRFKPLLVVAFGGVFYFAAFIAFGLVNSIPLFLAASVLFTLGEIVVTINIGTFTAEHSPAAYRGRINSINMFVRGAGSAYGPMFMGHVIMTQNYQTSWMLIAGIILVASLGMSLLNRIDTKHTTAPESADSAGTV